MILQGQDWSQITQVEGLSIGQSREEINQDTQASEQGDTEQNKSRQLFSLDYFERYYSLFGHTPSAFNLGIYQTTQKDEEVLKSTKYVGIVPLLKKKNDSNNNSREEKLPVVKISSRFGISPTDMISQVLAGDDYYENPDMLKTKSYSMQEWRQLSSKVDEDHEKVLFGLINGIGSIDLFSNAAGKDGASETDVGIADAYGVFEIIDFVNKAKNICRKNLKKQSQRAEENLNCKVKGRILIQKQIKYNISKGQNQKTYCSYNKMSDDIKENQIIKYALFLCQKNHGIGDSLAEDIRFCMNILSGVPLKKCSVSDFVGLKNNGAFREYKEALNAAKKVIGRYSLSYSNEAGENLQGSPKATAQLTNGKVLPFFIDMNLSFEYYCRAIFKKAVEEVNRDTLESDIKFELESSKDARRVLFPVTEDYWNKYVAGNLEEEIDQEGRDNENKLQRFFMPQYIPDIVITYSEGNSSSRKVAAVFDAKYSDVEKQEKRSRTHQVLFYMKALGCDYGGLISPYTGGDTDPNVWDKLNINHNISKGNPVSDEKDDTTLFYVPLIHGRSFDNYVGTAKEYLGQIRKGIAAGLSERNAFKDILDTVNRTNINALKKEELQEYVRDLQERISTMSSFIEK